MLFYNRLAGFYRTLILYHMSYLSIQSGYISIVFSVLNIWTHMTSMLRVGSLALSLDSSMMYSKAFLSLLEPVAF